MAQMMEAMRVAGVTARCDDACPEKEAALWSRFWSENVISTAGGSTMHAVYYEYDPHNRSEYTVLIGCEIDAHAPLPHGLCEVTVEAGWYEEFGGPGTGDADLQAMWKQVHQSHIDRTYCTDYEEYGSEGSANIFVSVKAPAPQHPPTHGGTSPPQSP